MKDKEVATTPSRKPIESLMVYGISKEMRARFKVAAYQSGSTMGKVLLSLIEKFVLETENSSLKLPSMSLLKAGASSKQKPKAAPPKEEDDDDDDDDDDEEDE